MRFQLERYLAGELDGEALTNVERLLATDEEAKSALAALEQEQREFEVKVPYAAFRIEHERRRSHKKSLRPRWRWGIGGAFAAAAVAWMVFLSGDPGPDEYVGLKGDGVALSFFLVSEDGTTTQGLTGQRVAAGDTLQLTYDASGRSHGALFGVDGSETVSQLWPAGDKSAALPASIGTYDFSLTLDDVPGRERFVAVFSDGPVRLDVVLVALRNEGPWPDAIVRAETFVVKR
ncbi:MAG: hypothetical protein AAFU77_13275 [Myxococcota bacterium]